MADPDPDPEAFRALYRAHYAAVCRFLAWRADAAAIEDVAAETFLVAWRRQHEIPGRPLPWLLNVATKCLANERRSGARRAALVQRLGGLPVANAPSVDQRVDDGARRRALVTALGTLRERDREVLLLHHWDGLPPRDIAVVLGLSPMLVRTHLHRAGRRLQRALVDSLEHEHVDPPLLHLTEVS